MMASGVQTGWPRDAGFSTVMRDVPLAIPVYPPFSPLSKLVTFRWRDGVVITSVCTPASAQFSGLWQTPAVWKPCWAPHCLSIFSNICLSPTDVGHAVRGHWRRRGKGDHVFSSNHTLCLLSKTQRSGTLLDVTWCYQTRWEILNWPIYPLPIMLLFTKWKSTELVLMVPA